MDYMQMEILKEYEEVIERQRELYKRYELKAEINAEYAEQAAQNDEGKLINSIEKNSCLNFDAVITENKHYSKSNAIKIEQNQRKLAIKTEVSNAEDMAKLIHDNALKQVTIEVMEGVHLELSILLLSHKILPVSIIVNVHNNASLSLLEWFASGTERGASAMLPMQQISVGKEAHADISMLHNENEASVLAGVSVVKAYENAELKLATAFVGNAMTKSALFANASGKNSTLQVNELAFGTGSQVFDTSTAIVNSAEETTAEDRARCVLFDNAHCIGKGFAKVKKEAINAYSYVEHRGLQIGSNTKYVPMPDMSIDTRNVKFASHSASSMPIDANAIFYMMSRGIGEEEAQMAFVEGFLSKHTSQISSGRFKEIVASALISKLREGKTVYAPVTSTKGIWYDRETNSSAAAKMKTTGNV